MASQQSNKSEEEEELKEDVSEENDYIAMILEARVGIKGRSEFLVQWQVRHGETFYNNSRTWESRSVLADNDLFKTFDHARKLSFDQGTYGADEVTQSYSNGLQSNKRICALQLALAADNIPDDDLDNLDHNKNCTFDEQVDSYIRILAFSQTQKI